MNNLSFVNEKQYDYFMYKGKRYPLNTVFIPTDKFKYEFKFPRNEMMVIEHRCNTETSKEWYVIVYGHDMFGDPCYHKVYKSPDKWIQSIVTQVNPNEKHYIYSKDTEVDEVVYGWIIYIALMLLLTIFNARIAGWIFLSAYFFTWRKKKLRKEKKYDY